LAIIVPPVHLKSTWYFEPSEKLNRFDEVNVVYENSGACTFLFEEEEMQEVIVRLMLAMQHVFQKSRQLSPAIQCGNLGYYFNQTIFDEGYTFDFSHYWWFSTRYIQTWLYTIDSKIYIEISPSYPWANIELPKNFEQFPKNFVSYEEFMKNYRPIAVVSISPHIAQTWVDQSKVLARELDIEEEFFNS
jgi:hypothetical protein